MFSKVFTSALRRSTGENLCVFAGLHGWISAPEFSDPASRVRWAILPALAGEVPGHFVSSRFSRDQQPQQTNSPANQQPEQTEMETESDLADQEEPQQGTQPDSPLDVLHPRGFKNTVTMTPPPLHPHRGQNQLHRQKRRPLHPHQATKKDNFGPCRQTQQTNA